VHTAAPRRPLEILSRRAWFELVAVALVARVAYLMSTRGEPLRSDAAHYHELAVNLAAGRGFVHAFPQLAPHPTAFRPPLYPALLAVVYRVTGPSPGVGRVVNLVIGIAVVVAATALAGRIGGRKAALVTGAVVAVYPPLIANDTVTLTEPLSLLLLLVTIHLLLDRRCTVAGAALGLLALTRPDALVVIAGLGVWVLAALGWRKALLLAAPVVLIVTPWLARNVLQVGTPTLTTSTGFNLAAIYSPEAEHDGNFVDPVFDDRFEQFRLAQFDEGEWERELRAYGLANLRRHPAQVLDVVGGNLLHWFELKPADSNGPEWLDGRNLQVRDLAIPAVWLVTAFGLAGLWSRRRDREGRLLAVALIGSSIGPLLFISAPRLRSSFDVLCVVGVGLAAARAPAWRQTLDRARPRRLAPLARRMATPIARAAVPVAAAAMLAMPVVAGLTSDPPVTTGGARSPTSPLPVEPASRPTPPGPLTLGTEITNPTTKPFVTAYARLDDDYKVAALNAPFTLVPTYTATWQLAPPGYQAEGLAVFNSLVLPVSETTAELHLGVSFSDGLNLSTAEVYELRLLVVLSPDGQVTPIGEAEGFRQVDFGGGPVWWPADVSTVIALTPAVLGAPSPGG